MKTCIIAISVLALGLLPQTAMASDGPAGSEVNNRHGDYIGKEAPTAYVEPFQALKIRPKKHRPVGEYVDETIEEQHQRSSNH
jgi:hypothetical protein